MTISENIKYVGVNDHNIDLFEGQFAVPNGMSYNSYIILDEKIAVMDSVDADFGEEWLSNIKNVLGNKTPDYLVVHHMEMDHSANILAFAKEFPDAKIVSSKMAFLMMKSYFGCDFADRQTVVCEGSKLSLGKHTLTFIGAPNVHWPEVLMSYEDSEKILFSADGFGKFGSLDKDEDWEDEAARYYFGIVGKFGDNVQSVLKKAESLDINKICPLHGPVLDKDLHKYTELYDIWSSYKPQFDRIFIPYTSVYGNTKKTVNEFIKILKEKGFKNVVSMDLAREDVYKGIETAFRSSKIVFASTTYNGGVFPAMREFIEKLVERNFKNRKVAFIENGAWAPKAVATMKKLLEQVQGIEFTGEDVTVKISPDADTHKKLESLADILIKS